MIKFLLLLCFPMLAAADWVEGSIAGVRNDNSKAPIAVFVNSYTPAGPGAGQWVSIDTAPMGIPADAKAVFLSGVLIITHGTTQQTCDLQVSLRAPGDQLNAGNYIGQTIEASVGNGMRSNMSSWVPVKNGHFEFWWYRSTYGQWPSECAYGINLSLQQYIR